MATIKTTEAQKVTEKITLTFEYDLENLASLIPFFEEIGSFNDDWGGRIVSLKVS